MVEMEHMVTDWPITPGNGMGAERPRHNQNVVNEGMTTHAQKGDSQLPKASSVPVTRMKCGTRWA